MRLSIGGLFSVMIALALSVSANASVVSVSPATGPPTIAITISGFPASSLVDIYFDLTQVGFGSTSSTGALVPFVVNVPASAAPGSHFVTVKNDGAAGGAQSTFIVRTNWSVSHWSSAQSNFNPTENTLTAATIGNLYLSWTAPVTPGSYLLSPPLIVNGMLYFADTSGNLIATTLSTHARKFSVATGILNNVGISYSTGDILIAGSGLIKAYNAVTGALVWHAAIGGGSNGAASAPTISNGVVYVYVEGATAPGMYAFSLTCGTSGAACGELWVGPYGSTGASWANQPPVVVGNGVVVANPLEGPVAWNTNCVPTAGACSPRWTTTVSEGTTGSFAAGFYWISDAEGQIGAFPVLCNTHCSPVKTLTTPNVANLAIAGSTIYASYGSPLLQFSTTCASSPCSPVATAGAPGGAMTPSVAGSLVYVEGFSEVWAYDRSCFYCGPIWSASANGDYALYPVVADGVLYIPDLYSGVIVYALGSGSAQPVARPAMSSLHRDPQFAAAEALAFQRLRAGEPINDLQPKAKPGLNEPE